LYLPYDCKSKLSTYNYFPANLVESFKTPDFDSVKHIIAEKCIELQIENDFEYLVIPTRYYEIEPSTYLKEFQDYIIDPFNKAISKVDSDKKRLVTSIVNETTLKDEVKRSAFLDWITGIPEIDGVYLIFENKSNSKQIKDADYLSEVLYVINALRMNELEVHVGYTNAEGILYSLVFPNSVSFGSYENLRRFGISRFTTQQRAVQQGPNARLYSAKLLQWIEYTYISAIQRLYSRWNEVFADSKYKPLIFTPEFNWHFQKPELYKHFFIEFSNQVKKLPNDYDNRKKSLIELFKGAMQTFLEIGEAGIYLDPNSDGSHLYHWLTSINLFEQKLKERA